MNRFRFLLSIRVLVLLAISFEYAAAQYRFDQWTADTGLPQNSVYQVRQARNGYLWLATLDGLVRFDGVRFTVFNRSNSPGIVNNRFTSVHETPDGDIWAGTEESGVVRYRRGKFTSYGVDSGFRQPNILHIYRDAGGRPLILLASLDLYRYADERFFAFPAEEPAVFAGNAEGQEAVFVYCRSVPEKKVYRCLANGVWTELVSPAPMVAQGHYQVVHDADGGFWHLSGKNGLIHFPNAAPAQVYREGEGLPGAPRLLLTGTIPNLLSSDRNGWLWITNLKTRHSELLTKSPPAAFTEIHTGYQDREGNYWFGTRRGGLFRVRKQAITTLSKDAGLSDNNVYPIYEDRQGNIWVGTTTGLYKFANGQFKLVQASKELNIYALGEDGAGRLLVGSYGELYTLEGDRLTLLYKSQLSFIWAIHFDRENNLWIGSQDGLVRIRDGAATGFTTRDGLAGNIVKVIIDDRDGGIWIGTYGGLSHYRDGKLTNRTDRDGLQSLTIRSLYQDGDGTLWIGSYDGGLSRFRDGKFTTYTTAVGLYNDGAFQILEDRQRNLWLSSNRGIYRVNKSELDEFADGRRRTITSVAYGKSDGLLNVETNGGRAPGGIRARDGRLWFPTQDGAAIVDPAKIEANPKPPPVIVEEIRINGQPVPVDALNAALDDPPTALELNPQQQNFEIKYTALSFINSENIRFKYRLAGLNPEWTDAGTRRTAYFAYVPPGEYAFTVIAANADGVWNETGRTVRIRVLPPFYRTWWFLILSVVSLGGFGYLAYRRRVSGLEREKQAQEELSRRLIELQENERKRLAGELHDSLSQNLVIIKNRAMMSLSDRENVEHAFEQIEEIAEAAVESLAEVREIAANLRPFQIDRLGLTKAIRALIRKASAPNLAIESRIDEIDDLLPPEMQINLYRILQESLNNIIKHSRATEAAVKIEKSEKTINIEIRDNGIGFDPNARGADNAATGFGLTGMHERARILGTVLHVESAPGNGAIVRFQINY